MDDSIEVNMLIFFVEMCEMVFIFCNVNESSFVVIDELGWGISIRDGLVIVIVMFEVFI